MAHPLVLPSNHLIVGVTTAVNPVVVVNCSLNVFPPTSFAAVVILILYVVKLEKLDGMKFNLLTEQWRLSSDNSVNYIAKFKKN